jgi:hypothetical protein
MRAAYLNVGLGVLVDHIEGPELDVVLHGRVVKTTA